MKIVVRPLTGDRWSDLEAVFQALMRLLLALLASGAGIVLADVAIPTVIIGQFEKDGKPYRDRVQFQVQCYGWTAYPGDPGFPPGKKPDPYVPKPVFGFSGDCESYGCEIKNNLYMNYIHVDYCDIEGTAGGKRFTVSRYGGLPVSRCEQGRYLPEFGGRRCELNVKLP